MDIKKTLICTDYDGTLSFEGIPKENVAAIERFMAAGGLFSLSTGRRGEEMLKRVADVVTVHAKDGAIAKIIDGLMADQPTP